MDAPFNIYQVPYSQQQNQSYTQNQQYHNNEVKAMMPQPGTTWYLKAAAELHTTQEDQSE